MADDHVLHVQLREHRRAHLAGERALRLEVAVLRAETDRDAITFERGLHRPQRGERGAHDDLDVVVVLLLEPVRELLHDLDRFEMRVVHLPVAGHERLAVCHVKISLSQARDARSAWSPGRSPSSMSSSAAPPPVDT